MVSDRRSQLAKRYLTHWKFLEENIEQFSKHDRFRDMAITFFTCLKKMKQEEIALLASRYYNSTVGNLFHYEYDTYSTHKAISYEVIANEYGESEQTIQLRLRGIEKKLGALLFKRTFGREWNEERFATKWCANCDSFKETTKSNTCIKCDKEFFDYKLYRNSLDAPSKKQGNAIRETEARGNSYPNEYFNKIFLGS